MLPGINGYKNIKMAMIKHIWMSFKCLRYLYDIKEKFIKSTYERKKIELIEIKRSLRKGPVISANGSK